MMRGLIIDHARNRSTTKRGGEFEFTPLEPDVIETCRREGAIDDRLMLWMSSRRSSLNSLKLSTLSFSAGFSFNEIAAMQKLSERTVQRRWEKARISHQGICANVSL